MKKTILIFIYTLIFLDIGRTAPNFNDLDQQTNDIKAVAFKLMELHDEGKLPGMSASDHGSLSGFQLTEANKKIAVDQQWVTKDMLKDVQGYEKSYVIELIRTDRKTCCYFFFEQNSDVALISAYQYQTNAWFRIKK